MKRSKFEFLQQVNKYREQQVLRQQQQERLKKLQAEKEAKQSSSVELDKLNTQFWENLKISQDFNDNLTELANYIQRNTGATGVYIGKLEKETQPIQEGDDDTAHIVEDAPLVIKFKHANDSHKDLMVGKVLKKDMGICHELFGEEEDEEAEAAEPEEDEENPETAEDKNDILRTFKHKFVPNVIREPKMHYWTVPKLGSFMAIPFVYKSCLLSESLDNALLDYIDVLKRQEEQNEQKREYNEEQETIKEERLKAGEKYEPEEKEWEEIVPAPFYTVNQKFVLCIDTLGQDLVLTDDQKRFCLQTAQQFIQKWEQFETEQLVRDRNARLESNKLDHEFIRENADKIKDDEEIFVDEQFAALDEDQEPANEEIKNLMTTQYQLKFQAKMFLENEEFKKRFDALKNFKVIKYHRFLQSLIYLL